MPETRVRAALRARPPADNLRPHSQGNPGVRPGRTGFVAIIPLANLIGTVIGLYIWVLIATAVLSWLTAFGIVNRHNPVVNGIGRFCYALTEPVLRPIRRSYP